MPPLSTSPLTLAELLDRGALDSKTRPALGGLGVSPATTAVLEALDAAEVDEPVGVLEQPVPRYPSALAGAGITGRVKLAFVVDTAGRAEPGSLRTVFSTHPDFEAAARASVLAGRFRAARLRGAPVPQLVHQTLSFRLEE